MNIQSRNKRQKLEIGEPIPYFCMTATDEKIYSSNSFPEAACLVVIFTSNHCPYAKLYEERIVSTSREFAEKGVQFLAICSNDGQAFPEDCFENMKLKKYPFPYLHDETQQVAKSFDAQATPEAFVFDSNLALKYHGAIDDSPETKSLIKKNFLTDAIVSVLKGEMLQTTEAPLIGCSIKWKIR